jgi:hypothetical protein
MAKKCRGHVHSVEIYCTVYIRYTARQIRTLHEVLEFCDIVSTCRHLGKAEVINLSYVFIRFWDTVFFGDSAEIK